MLLVCRTWAFVFVVPLALGVVVFYFCKYGKWKTNGFSTLMPSCLTSLHLSIFLSALHRIARDAVWVV